MWWPESLVRPDALKPFEGTVGYKNHANPRKGEIEEERSVDDMAWYIEKTFVDGNKPRATVRCVDEQFYKKAKRAKAKMGVSIYGDCITSKPGIMPDGKLGKMVLGFTPNIRADAVAQAGAGGYVGRVREAQTTDYTGGDFVDITLEALEADEKGKELLTKVREAAVASVKAEFDALKTKNDELTATLAEKDVEINSIRESANDNNTSDNSELIEKLAKKVNELVAQNAAMELKDAINTKVRESQVPSTLLNEVTEILTALPRDKWDGYLATVKAANPVKNDPVIQGNVEGVREGSNPPATNVNPFVNTNAATEAVVKGLFGMSLEEFNKQPAGGRLEIR